VKQELVTEQETTLKHRQSYYAFM